MSAAKQIFNIQKNIVQKCSQDIQKCLIDSKEQDMQKKQKTISMPFHINKPILNKNHKYYRQGEWTRKQKNKFTIFLDQYKQLFKKQNRKKHKIFIYMSQFMKTRNAMQCRSHHQKQIKQFQELGKVVENRKNKIGLKQYEYYQKLYHEQLSTIQFQVTNQQTCLHGKSSQKNITPFLQKKQCPFIPQIKLKKVNKQHPTNSTHHQNYQASQVKKQYNDDNNVFYESLYIHPNIRNVQSNFTGAQASQNLATNLRSLKQYYQTINACNYYLTNYVKASMKLHQIISAKK